MERTQEVIKQENFFLELCSEPYKEMVWGNREMSINDFNRICYAIEHLELLDFFIYFTFHFEELYNKSEEEEEKKKREYDSHFSDSDNLYAKMDKWNTWLQEFWEQMPLESQKKKYKARFLD